MVLTQYIKELLYLQECVTLPGFGSFLVQNHPIEINRFTGEFIPPRRSISFNRLIQDNDGLLASHVARRENITYAEALIKVEEEAIHWNKRLSNDVLILPGIGEFSLNAENKLRFLPHGRVNFDANALGLKAFQKTPLKAQIKAASVIPPSSSSTPKSSPMQNPQKESLAFTPEKQEEKRPPYLKYIGIGVLAVALLGATYYFGNQYLESERAKSAELAQKRIAKNVQEASFDLGAIAALSYTTTAEIETIQEDGFAVESGQFYSIIAGSFSDANNAERKLASLKEQGFDAAYAEKSSDGLIRVAYGRFESKRKAYQLLNFVKYSLEEEAWYLVEGY